MKMTPEQLTEKLQTVFGNQLNAVVLYGSAVTDDFVPKKSDYNILVVLEQLQIEHLELFSKTAKRWVKQGNPPPLFFTPEGLRNSCDTFPIEFLDIQAAHRMLYGEDLVSGLEVHLHHLRHELESELKAKLLGLREHFLLNPTPRGIKQLLAQSTSNVLVLFRAALRLWQEEVPLKKMDALNSLSQHIGLDTAVFDALDQAKRTGKWPIDLKALFSDYLRQIEQVTEAVDTKELEAINTVKE